MRERPARDSPFHRPSDPGGGNVDHDGGETSGVEPLAIELAVIAQSRGERFGSVKGMHDHNDRRSLPLPRDARVAPAKATGLDLPGGG
jgi:hypothetical protein